MLKRGRDSARVNGSLSTLKEGSVNGRDVC